MRQSAIGKWFRALLEHWVLVAVSVLLESAAAFILHAYFPSSPLTALVANSSALASIWLMTAAGIPFIKIARRFIAGSVDVSRISITDAVGLERFLPHDTADQRQSDWSTFATRIKEERPDLLRILVCTGADTFARPGSPLRWALEKHQKDLQILVALPGTFGFERRLRMLHREGETERKRRERYLEQHNDTKEFCRILADQRVKYHHMRSIEVRGYSWPVTWKMIACRDHLWLQHYCYPITVEETPAYFFREGENSSLFVPFEGHFNSYWDGAALLLKYASDDAGPTDNWDRALREATNQAALR